MTSPARREVEFADAWASTYLRGRYPTSLDRRASRVLADPIVEVIVDAVASFLAALGKERQKDYHISYSTQFREIVLGAIERDEPFLPAVDRKVAQCMAREEHINERTETSNSGVHRSHYS